MKKLLASLVILILTIPYALAAPNPPTHNESIDALVDRFNSAAA